MKIKCFAVLLILSLSVGSSAKNKVAQSGMTYLGISMGARETAMGDASTASTHGIQGLWHNPAVLTEIQKFEFVFNQVDWFIDSKLYGTALAFNAGKLGTFALDVTYMDFGDIMGTRRVDKSVDLRGFQLTGNIGVEDWAIGFAYARSFSNKFSMGIKIKRLHENLGMARYVTSEFEDAETGTKARTYNEKEWEINDWGLDFGTLYHVGWKSLTVGMSMQNFSRDMKYWYEEFSTPMVLRMGASMDVLDFWPSLSRETDLILAVDALHPNDHTERVHVGSELILFNRFALRAGYKFNHSVESLTAGVGLVFDYSGLQGILNYAYGTAEYFDSINRLTFSFSF